MKRYKFGAAAGAFLLVASSANATVVSGLNSSSIMVSGSSLAGDDGSVAGLTIARSDAGSGGVEQDLAEALDQTVTMAAYGFGTLRAGEDQYGSFGNSDQLPDFNDGTAGRDALSGILVLTDDGGLIVADNSTGTSFIAGEAEGVNPFVAPAGGMGPIERILDSIFGKFSGDVEVIYRGALIQSLFYPAPEPATMFLVGVALVVLSLMGPKRRHR